MSDQLPQPAPPPGTVPDAAPLAPAGWPAFPAPEEGLDWRRAWGAVVRYRWWVVLLSVLGLGAGVGAARLLKPKYLVQATIWIETSDRSGGGFDPAPIRSGQLLDSYAWVDLLRSYLVLDDVVRNERLYLHPDEPGDSGLFASFQVADRFRPGAYRLVVGDSGKSFALLARGGVLVQRGVPGDSIGPRVGFRWALPAARLTPGRTVSFAVTTLRGAAQALSGRLQAHIDAANGNFMRLELTGPDPARTTATLNALVRRYVEVAAELKRAKLTELTKILDAQLGSAELSLRNAETALETFRVHTITLPSEPATPVTPGLDATRDPVFTNYFDMQVELEQLRRDHDAIRRVLAQVPDSGLSVEALTLVGAVQRSVALSDALKELTSKQAELRALRYRYTDSTVAVRRLSGDIAVLERRTVPQLAQRLLAELASREVVVQRRIATAGGELRAIPARAIEEARLRREVAIDEHLYTTLLQRYEEARLADASSIPDIRELDPAIAPEHPMKNTAPRLIVLGLLGGLGVALVGAVLLDRIDSRVRYPDQVTGEMGLPILGALPHVKPSRNGKELQHTAQVIEALREVRLNLIHASGGAGPLAVTISSPGMGDGKSFLSSNLALAFGAAGYRTLLLDGDMRRGALHRLLRGARTPGLADYLAGTVRREAIIQATSYPSVFFIGSGARRQTSPELLGSPAMLELLAALRASFSVVVIDSPPLGAGVDPYLLGATSGSLLLVLRTGASDRAFTRARLPMLDRLRVRVLGAVLNDVPPNRLYGYYSYLPGYATTDEPGVAVARPRGAS